MPFSTVRLQPGVVTQVTQSQNEAGVSKSNLIRYHDGLIQKLGGWQNYYPVSVTSTIREIHPWQGLQGVQYLAVGQTQQLAVINSNNLFDVTPTTETRDFTPNFTISSGSTLVKIIDPGSSASLFDTVFFNTQIAVGNLLLQGAYPVSVAISASAYQITSSVIASTTITSSGILPVFTTTANSATVSVLLPNNNYQSITGLFEGYYAPTSIGGNLTIKGPYETNTVIDSTNYTIITPTQATSADTQTMNGGQAELVYYRSNGPPASGSGFGGGGYGGGGFGVGSSGSTIPVLGTPITATDWTMENWGEILLACPTDGPIYAWSGDSGFTTASVVETAPFFNGGIYVSQPQQILVAWRSVESTGVQDPLIVRWSDSGDYTNWAVTNQTAAGSFHIPTGSKLVAGIQAGLTGVIWTDIDVWLQSYVGGDVIFNHTKVGSGCGIIGPHAAGHISGQVFWCGQNNFFTLSGSGVSPMPCTVWDFIFQNINRSYASRVRCATNSMFNEVAWYFPSTASTGENDSYVRYNLVEGEWDYGTLQRTAWSDVTALGNPIGTDITKIYQHELTNDASGIAISPSFESGYWTIAEGEQMAFVDWLLPDMKFGLYSGSQNAQCQVTLRALDYVGSAPRTYGPFIFTNQTQYLNPRLRGRYMSISITSSDIGSFWRIGAVKYRYSTSGRR